MKLSQPAQENGYVAFAELPADDQMLPHGFTCYITGWGMTDNENKVANFNQFLDKNTPAAFLFSLLFHSVGQHSSRPPSGSCICGGTSHLLPALVGGQYGSEKYGLCRRQRSRSWMSGTFNYSIFFCYIETLNVTYLILTPLG